MLFSVAARILVWVGAELIRKVELINILIVNSDAASILVWYVYPMSGNKLKLIVPLDEALAPVSVWRLVFEINMNIHIIIIQGSVIVNDNNKIGLILKNSIF